MQLTLRQLHYFIVIVDAGNMTRAADSLHVAPTALSLQVRVMEERLGVALLERHSRGVRATRAGDAIYHRGRQILAMVDDMERHLGPDEGRRDIRLGTPPSALRPVGIGALVEGARSRGHPSMRVFNGLSYSLAEQLLEGALDFALVCDLPPSDTIRQLDLIEEALVFVTSPEDAHAGGVTLSEALATDLIFSTDRGACWKLVDTEARKSGLALRVRQMVGSLDTVRHLVGRGLGTAILPFGSVAPECADGTLVAHEIVDRAMYRRTSLAWLPESPDAAEASDFIDLVVDTVGDLHARTPAHSRLLAHPESRPSGSAPRAGTSLLAFALPGLDPGIWLQVASLF